MRNALEITDATMRSMANTLTFGQADHLASYLTPGNTAKNLAKEKAKTDEYLLKHPYASAVGSLGALGVGAISAAAGLVVYESGATVFGGTLLMIGTGVNTAAQTLRSNSLIEADKKAPGAPVPQMKV